MSRSLHDLLLGRGAYAPVPHLLEGLEPHHRQARPNGVAHSLYDHLWHLVFWQEWELAALRGEPTPPVPHAADSWPRADGERPTWDELGDRFAAGAEALAALAEAAEAAPAKTAPAEAASPGAADAGPERRVAVRAGVGQIVAHTAYHAGQMVLLRQMLGAWPPPAGGDTW